ncbi:MAG TPA: hypothetical protein VF552_11070 [Allosphingosinicella sp.]|jgi:hypothetical protein
MLDLPPALIATIYCAAVALAVVVIDWLLPRCSRTTLVLGASLPVPLAILATAAWFILQIGPPAPDEIDAGGMAAMAFMVMGMAGAGLSFFLGAAAAFLAARTLRAP